MKCIKLVVVVVLLVAGISHVNAQVPTTQVLPDTAKMTYSQISKAAGMYVFPSNEQSQQQQKRDEYECYLWAMEQSGIDPLNLPKIEVEQVATGPDGGAVRGAAGGAAKGAIIGAVAGDAGKGAAIGATAGGMRGVGRSAARQQNAQKQAEANVATQEKEMKESFLKAFSVCMEGKGYTIK